MSWQIEMAGELRQEALGQGAMLPARILIVEPNDERGSAFTVALEAAGAQTVWLTAHSAAAREGLRTEAVDLIVADWDFLEQAGEVARGAVKIPVIVLTSTDGAGAPPGPEAKRRFEVIGVVSRHQPVEGVAEQIHMLCQIHRLGATG
jgi:CheY-like chemotaxis protein